jgi:hypothetical protein
MRSASVIPVLVAILGLAAAAAIVSFFVWSEVTSHIERKKIQDRVGYWTSVVNAGIRVGESRDDAEAWLRHKFSREIGKRALDDPFDHYNLVVAPESIPAARSDIACSRYIILIDISIGHDDRVSSRKVTSDGECM